MYYPRLIDDHLKEWASSSSHKPLLLRGARQVGKSSAVKNLGKQFETFVEINFEKQRTYKQLFKDNLNIEQIVTQLSALTGKRIIAKKTLLFFDEIQECPDAIMALRFFREDMPDLHVIAAGSLLEFALMDLPTFGVGRIHSMFMYPMTFDEFLIANGENQLLELRNKADNENPLPEAIYQKLIQLFRTFILVGGMPEVVAKWVETHNYLACQELQDDIVVAYEDDFAKYKKRVDPILLRQTLRSAAVQSTNKFVYSRIGEGIKTAEAKTAVELLILAGILIPITRTSANGLPLGGDSDVSFRKILILDSGLMLRLLNMATGDISELTSQILTENVANLVNKGPMAELIAGLELLHYLTPNIKHELYYWVKMSRNSQAEVDYITNYKTKVLPIEVKAGVQGGMKSLWAFMKEKKLSIAVRCSLENFSVLNYEYNSDNTTRKVQICPLYAISQLSRLLDKHDMDFNSPK